MATKERKENKQIGTYYVHTKKDGSTVYKKQIKLGIDSNTGKDAITTISAKNVSELRTLIERKKREFVDNGNTLKKFGSAETFEGLCNLWWDNYRDSVKLNSQRRIKNILNVYLLPAFGKLKLERITTVIVQTQVNDWAKKANSVPPGTRRPKGHTKDYKTNLVYLKKILTYGVTLQLIDSNPAGNIKAPTFKKEKGKKKKHFDKVEFSIFERSLDRLQPCSNSEFAYYRNEAIKVYLRLLAYSGFRGSEALALLWTDINFETNMISITKTLDNKGILEDTPKSESSIRTIKMDQETMRRLKVWKIYQGQARLYHGLPKAEHIFYSLMEEKIYPIHQLRKTFQKICIDNNLPQIDMHGLRHTHASILLAAEVGYKEIQARLGHSTLSMTMNIYSHLYEEKKDKAVDLMIDFLSS